LVVSVLDVLFAGVDVDFYACATGVLLLRLFVAVLFVDVDLFTVLRLGLRLSVRLRTTSAVFENAYVFGVRGLAALSRLDVDGEGFLVFRVTFPPCLW
jgi:hypothetical protein